jgi:hypothetical protein
LTRIGDVALVRRIPALLVFLVFLPEACGQRGANKELIVTIRTIVEILAQEKSTVEQLAGAIGRITEKERRRYRLAPVDDRFEAARLGFEPGPGEEKPRYVELRLRADAVLRVTELAEAFGKGEKGVAPPPPGSPHQLRFRFDRAGDAYLVTLDASLTGPEGADSTKVESLNIRREERM